jgi:pheromone shutdown-related protein TraB
MPLMPKANLQIKTISEDIEQIIFPDQKELYLIGTAHVSATSVEVVTKAIQEIKPDTIAVELDAERLEVLQNRKKYEQTDIIKVIKKKKVLFLIAQLIMTAYQKKIAQKLGVKPGAEFKKAVNLATETNAKLVLADRNIGLTLKRLVGKLSFWTKMKLFFSLFLLEDKDTDFDEEKIKELKNKDNLSALIGELGESLPVIKAVLLDERNLYLATKIKANLGPKTVAVVGAAHIPGMIECFRKESNQDTLKDLEKIPVKSKLSKIIPWVFPALILGMFIYGFFYGNPAQVGQAVLYWILINGVLTALGCILAFGHPLTIPAGFIAAPITSLNPLIGAGMVVGLLQLFLVRPKVLDFEQMGEDIISVKGWWKNKLTRALLVSTFASLGSSIGTFAALPFVLNFLA